ncbi:MAG: hypothetical protein ACYTEQ_05815 [Planctomycetota bacterium]|jgi:hypothetical protein
MAEKLDIATHLMAETLVALAGKIKADEYGPDTAFDAERFLDELDDLVVRPLGGEIDFEWSSLLRT